MLSNPQHSHLGIESNASAELNVAPPTGGVFVITAAGLEGLLMRAVSFFGPGSMEAPPKFSVPTGSLLLRSDSGTPGWVEVCKKDDDGFIVGGVRRGGTAGARDGRTIPAGSGLAAPFCGPGSVSSSGGSAVRTVSFFGSAMGVAGLRREKSLKFPSLSLTNLSRAAFLAAFKFGGMCFCTSNFSAGPVAASLCEA